MKIHQAVYGVMILFFAALVWTGCNDSGWESSGSHDTGGGWVDTASFSVKYTEQGTGYAELNGTAFISFNYVRHRCVGYACYGAYYDDSEPGVTVTWENITTGASGSACSRYGNLTDWQHRWSATVPLVSGVNDIVLRAEDPGGRWGTAEVTLEHVPPPPSGIRPDTGDGRIALMWNAVPGATSYNVYWSIAPGVDPSRAAFIRGVTGPFTHTGLTNGQRIYYVMTSNSVAGESFPSEEVDAVAGAPSRPHNVAGELSGSDLTLSWDPVEGASMYNVYWRNEPDVTAGSGRKAGNVRSPWYHSGLVGITYFYVVTAVNAFGESLESDEIRVMPDLPPPAPTGLKVQNTPCESIGRGWHMEIEWSPVPGAQSYVVLRCDLAMDEFGRPGYCSLKVIGYAGAAGFVDHVFTGNYGYSVRARNSFGTGSSSEVVSAKAPSGLMGYVYSGSY